MYKNFLVQYYRENKQRLQKRLLEDIKTFLKKKKWQYVPERYKNISEDKKQKLVEYIKNIIEWEDVLL